MSGATNDCRCPYLEHVSLLVLQALPENEAESMREHLQTCEECRQEDESLRPLLPSLDAWPIELLSPPRSLWGRLAERVGTFPSQATVAASPPWSEPKWEEAATGVSYKLLSEDPERQRVSMLVRLAPGAAYPPHTHAGTEELHLLHGELWIDDRKLFPGDYYRAEPGTADTRVWSETGCSCVLITSTRDVLR